VNPLQICRGFSFLCIRLATVVFAQRWHPRSDYKINRSMISANTVG